MNRYQIATLILLVLMIVSAMVWGRAWLAWPLPWKLGTAWPLVGLFGWLGWRGANDGD